MLIIFFGNIGAGKTSLAEAFARLRGFEFICFDHMVSESVEKQMIYSADDEFLLSTGEIEKVYSDMHLKAANLIKQGRSVVLESMYFRKQREDAKSIAKTLNVPYRLVEFVCEEHETLLRLKKRKEQNPQTAGERLYRSYKEYMEPEPEAHVVLDTTGKSLMESLRLLESKLDFD